MDPVDLFLTIVCGAFAANILCVVFLFGVQEGLKHTSARTMPGWGLLCLGIPLAIFFVLLIILTQS